MKKNDIKKRALLYERLLMIVLFVIPFALLQWELDNDIWFLLTHGRYVLSQGFPVVEPFSLHEGFSFVMQQWLSAVIFWFFFSHFGKIGVVVLIVVCTGVTSFLILLNCRLLSGGQKWISSIVSSVSSVIIILFFEVSRPQIFTFLIVLVEMFCLEKYHQEGCLKSLFVLPFLFLLQSNLHAAMLFLPVAVYIAYLIDFVLRINFSEIRKSHFKIDKQTGLFVGSGMLSAIAVFLNPYGKDAVFYLFHSTDSTINALVSEMKPPLVRELPGILFYFCLFLIIFCYLFVFAKRKYERIQTRFVLLQMGMILLVLMSQKSIPYFIFFAFVPAMCCLRDGEIKLHLSIKNRRTDIVYALSTVLLLVSLPVAFLLGASRYDGHINYFPYKNALDYLNEKAMPSEVTLFTGYDEGGYAEYLGFRPYLDSRAEVYLEKTNKKKNVIEEYFKLRSGKLYYKDFIKKYGFDHLLVEKGTSLDVNLSHDADFNIFYQDKNYVIYHKKN